MPLTAAARLFCGLLCCMLALLILSGCARTGNQQVSPDDVQRDQGIPLRDTLEEYSWQELSAIAGLIAQAQDDSAAAAVAKQYNLADDQGFPLGQTKQIEVNGQTRRVRIVAFRHEQTPDGHLAGITLMFIDPLGEYGFTSSVIGDAWEESSVRTWLNSSALSALPEDLSQLILTVENNTAVIESSESGPDSSTNTSEQTPVFIQTEDHLWLPAMDELAGNQNWGQALYQRPEVDDAWAAEGSQFAFYELRNESGVSAENNLIGVSGSHFHYLLLRSALPKAEDMFRLSADNCGKCHDDGRAISFLIEPCFCL